MKITLNKLKKLEPCEDRLNNFLQYYPKFFGSLKQFIELENITYNDKVWAATKLFTKKQNVKWVILCAESVLYNFESVYPNNKRPRKAIEAAKKYLKNPSGKNKSAAWSVTEFAAESARSAADFAVWSATEFAEKKQKELNLSLMSKCIKK